MSVAPPSKPQKITLALIKRRSGFLLMQFAYDGYCRCAKHLSYLPLLLICAAASTPLMKKGYEKLCRKCGQGLVLTADTVRVAGLMLMSVAYLISGSYNPFLYFRF